jgi:plastocyanin
VCHDGITPALCTGFPPPPTSTITFADFAYSPKCAQVRAGSSVTFEGDFTRHPLSETCGPVGAIPPTATGTSLSVTFTTIGIYGYQCDAHHATEDMVGAIQVVP